MDDVDIPGCVSCFIYDEFHPDPVYESEKSLREIFFPALFSIAPIGKYFFCVDDHDLLVNGKLYTTLDQLKDAINYFKSFYEALDLMELHADPFSVQEDNTVNASGYYKAMARVSGDTGEIIFEGKFNVLLQPDGVGYWCIKNLDMEGINF